MSASVPADFGIGVLINRSRVATDYGVATPPFALFLLGVSWWRSMFDFVMEVIVAGKDHNIVGKGSGYDLEPLHDEDPWSHNQG